MNFNNKHVLVLGAGISGIGAAKALAQKGARVVLSDVNALSAEITAPLVSDGIECVFGEQQASLLADIDWVVVSPGIAMTNDLIQSAKASVIPVIGEIELAYLLTSAPIYAITGTNGKTTTTTLLANMIEAAGLPYVFGGNIGTSLSETVVNMSEESVIVAEISSFQLETIHAFRARGAAILNITPDHIERHGTMEEYVRVKGRITENQNDQDFLVINKNDANCRMIAQKASCTVYEIDTTKEVDKGAYVENGILYIKTESKKVPLVSVDELQIKGQHNCLNALTAGFLAYKAGVPVRVIVGVLRTFKGLPHRVELVKELDGVHYYNDSKATNADATIQALRGFSDSIVWIAGGYDKGTDLTELMRAASVCAGCVFTGAAADRFADAAKRAGLPYFLVEKEFTKAVHRASAIAKELGAKVILFSPACSSFDMFKNYRERGTAFVSIVKSME